MVGGPPAAKKRKTAPAKAEETENGAGENGAASGEEDGEGEEEVEEKEGPQDTAKTSAPTEEAAKVKGSVVSKDPEAEAEEAK